MDKKKKCLSFWACTIWPFFYCNKALQVWKSILIPFIYDFDFILNITQWYCLLDLQNYDVWTNKSLIDTEFTL